MEENKKIFIGLEIKWECPSCGNIITDITGPLHNKSKLLASKCGCKTNKEPAIIDLRKVVFNTTIDTDDTKAGE